MSIEPTVDMYNGIKTECQSEPTISIDFCFSLCHNWAHGMVSKATFKSMQVAARITQFKNYKILMWPSIEAPHLKPACFLLRILFISNVVLAAYQKTKTKNKKNPDTGSSYWKEYGERCTHRYGCLSSTVFVNQDPFQRLDTE